MLLVVVIVLNRFRGQSLSWYSPLSPSLIAVVATAFLITSFLQACGNWFEKWPAVLEALEGSHIVTTIVFVFVLSFSYIAAPNSLLNETAVAVPIVLVIHTVRYWLDRKQAKLCGTPPRGWREAVEAVRYLAVILCALVGAASKDPVLVWCAIALSVMLILKELKFRIVDEINERLDPVKARERLKIQQNVTFPFAVAKVFLGHFFKSMIYIGVGFALLFENLALVDKPGALVIRSESSSGIAFLDYLYFSLGLIHHNAYGDVTPVSAIAKALAGLEQVISSIMLTLVIALLIESINTRYRRAETLAG
ncbi:ion channel [Sphingomonas sp. LT1P40]|uniref:ion channel n=1 Tax=Alteristakelama amylovorans TaxID=3096166 RepID=UPI002FCB113C